MPTYEFWYNETYTYKGYLTADSKEQAQELILDQAVDYSELPNFHFKDKGFELDADLGTLEEVSE